MPMLLVLRMLYNMSIHEPYSALLSLGLRKLVLDSSVQGCDFVIRKLGGIVMRREPNILSGKKPALLLNFLIFCYGLFIYVMNYCFYMMQQIAEIL
nr:unnamed protein product [Callosobruchus analis]